MFDLDGLNRSDPTLTYVDKGCRKLQAALVYELDWKGSNPNQLVDLDKSQFIGKQGLINQLKHRPRRLFISKIVGLALVSAYPALFGDNDFSARKSLTFSFQMDTYSYMWVGSFRKNASLTLVQPARNITENEVVKS